MFGKYNQVVRCGLAAACLSVLATSAVLAQGIEARSDIAYKTGPGLSEYEIERCKLDLYIPEGVEDFPIIVWFHGGAITAGRKDSADQVAIAEGLARRGIGVASVNYRLSPNVSYPAYIEDAAAAVSWVLDNIGEYGGNAGSVFVAGHSAGGYLAAMTGIDPQYLAAHGHALSDLAGVIPVSGQMITHVTVRSERGISNSQPIIDEAAPTYHVGPEVPPFLTFVGTEDIATRAEENAYFVEALKAAGQPDATYIPGPGRTHGTIVTQIPEEGDLVADAIVAFVERLSN